MRTKRETDQIFQLAESGLNDCEIARRIGLPRTTVRDWRRRGSHSEAARRGVQLCDACGRKHRPTGNVDPASYTYLLGIYLGDGHITEMRSAYRLRVFLDSRYRDLNSEVATAMRAVSGTGAHVLNQVRGDNLTIITSYSNAWACLLPQHGPGRKHERLIALTDWQRELCAGLERQLVRGLIHSDGCRCLNRVKAGGRQYEYPRYLFENASGDIREIYSDALDQLGIAWTQSRPRTISVARREAVAEMDRFIGPKH